MRRGRASCGASACDRIGRHAILLAWTGFITFPIFWMVSTSFKDAGEWVAWPPHWLPHQPTLHNYAQIFAFGALDPTLSRQATEQAFTIWKGLGDAVLVCTTASLLALLLGTFLAYSISRFNVGGKYFRHTILMIRMIPPIVVAISILIYYAIIIPYATSALFGVRVSLFDTYVGLVLIYTVTTLPFVIWMMLTFIDEVPYTLEHAARLMGAGPHRGAPPHRPAARRVGHGGDVPVRLHPELGGVPAGADAHPSRGDDADGAAQQVPERGGGTPLWTAGRHRHRRHRSRW